MKKSRRRADCTLSVTSIMETNNRDIVISAYIIIMGGLKTNAV